MFLIVDGIDGCGKGTIVQALAERRRKAGARVFDVREFARRERRLPEPEEFTDASLVLSGEPTYAWIGAAIREEIVRANHRDYSASRTAEAFALDRLLHYRRIVLPARARGQDIILERSVTSTLVYQMVQESTSAITLEHICALEGNTLALSTPPDMLLLLTVEPSRALQRLDLRTEKRDEAIFERLGMLERLHAGYRNPAFRAVMAQHHWRIAEVDANGAVEDAVARAAARVDALVAAPMR